MKQQDDITGTTSNKDALKSALHIGLLNLGHKTASYESSQHMQRLQRLGVTKLMLTVKGLNLSEPDICMFEFDVPENLSVGG